MKKLIDQNAFLKKYNIKDEDFQNTGLNWNDLEEIYNEFIADTPILEAQLLKLFSVFVKQDHVHSVRYRVKSPEHLVEKIIRKKILNPDRSITSSNYRSEIDDLIGMRILHLFKDEWKSFHDYIIGNFDLKESPTANYRDGDPNEYLQKYEENGCALNPHKYGYRSIHYIIKCRILSETIGCEIQVRTIFEEAWSEIDHTIRYPYYMDDAIFKQYLMIVNRLAGSADEMGTFIVTLKEHLAGLALESEIEINRKNTLIKELKDEIVALQVSKEKRNSINNKISKLSERFKEAGYSSNFPYGSNTILKDWISKNSFDINNSLYGDIHRINLDNDRDVDDKPEKDGEDNG
ncbi:RelA/SpoT domain-containing protein [Bacteroides graminisolvens]